MGDAPISRRRLVCPACSKRGVTLRFVGAEDHYGCRYCVWYVFTNGFDPLDVERREALRQSKPDHPGKPMPEWELSADG